MAIGTEKTGTSGVAPQPEGKTQGLAALEQMEQTTALSVQEARHAGLELAKAEVMGELETYTAAYEKLSEMKEQAMQRLRTSRRDRQSAAAQSAEVDMDSFFKQCGSELRSLTAPTT